MASENTNVIINGHTFFAISVVDLEMELRPLEHPAEHLFNVTDHIKQEPHSFKLSLKLMDRWIDSNTLAETRDEKLDLLKLWHNDRLLSVLQTDLGNYDNMLITKVRIIENTSSESAFSVEIKMKEVQIAFLQPISEQWYVDEDGSVYEQTPYERTTVDGTLSKPKPSDNSEKGWTIGHNVGEVFGWIVSAGDDGIEWRWPWD